MSAAVSPILLPEGIREIAEYFCGCGSPEEAWGWVRRWLEACSNKKRPCWPFIGSDYIAAYLLNKLRITEHGVGVEFGWLTEKGKEALAFLQEYGPEWESRGEFIDSRGCSWGKLW